tara:strand:+ start:8321 stop:8818 length:498 start_codon:yes stop_codon:yes gene_type:complete
MSTNIDDLPSDNIEENIKLETSPEKNNINTNAFVNGIQQAAATGALELQSRDIPTTQTHITQDSETRSDYIPKPTVQFDIPTYTHVPEIKTDKLDLFYNELQIPITLAVLYFIFQLPLTKKTLLNIIPSLFKNDGNMNLYGYIFTSLLYATSYFIMNKSMQYFSL